ncbi:MAG TPA: serine kinase, partial [Isosphaeraceae bacterium]|nr:serine kinase [Isosphaeraceae bacterium]
VAGDMARLLAEWVGPDRTARAESLAAYASMRALNEAETRLISAFETANALLGAGQWARWYFLEGRRFDDPGAVLRGLERGLHRIVSS